ncbi:MAG: repair protein RecN [Acidobacteriota bacterium]|jgi:DNA repair protein RecN (Recombination protein N)|nr:repair protein RecN [Acidobacteriota bacterium]
MLKSLNISGFAVIDHLQVGFRPGLNVLTGETGSGKSIIVDALGLLLGGRSSSAQIRTGEAQASVEGVFQFAKGKENRIRDALSDIGLRETLDLRIRREIYTTGKGRIFINDRSVTAGVLRKLQPFLSEIYGQGEQRSLLSAQSHRELLDHFGGCAALKNDTRRILLHLKSAERELKQLVGDLDEQQRSKEFIQYQLAEIDAIRPKGGEDYELLAERKMLAHAERIIELGSSAYHNLYESDDSILARLTLIRRQLEELGSYLGNTGIALDSLLSGIASLTDAAEALRRYSAGVEYSPGRLTEVESRLAELERVKRKYGTDLDGILKIQDELTAKLSKSGDMAERINTLRNEVEVLRGDYIESAGKLTSCRREAAPILEQRVMEGLRHVAMRQATFLVSVETSTLEDEETAEESYPTETSADESSDSAFFTPNGADYVEFLLSANPGESPRPLSYVASGGELSRLMLALRTASQEDETFETIVFDEIDVGIGGRVAEAVGQLLKSLSASRQVFCVTHQAQIAKFADHHFVVTKEVEGERTHTSIKELVREERISELSRMIGGDEKAEKTRDAAQWLLENAKGSRQTRTKRSN